MRPVKKALKMLERPDTDMSKEKQIVMARKWLLKAGRHIEKIIERMKEVKAKAWKNNLWSFVAGFTEYKATKLYRTYRHAANKEGRRKKADWRGNKKERDGSWKHRKSEGSGNERDKDPVPDPNCKLISLQDYVVLDAVGQIDGTNEEGDRSEGSTRSMTSCSWSGDGGKPGELERGDYKILGSSTGDGRLVRSHRSDRNSIAGGESQSLRDGSVA